MDSPVSDSGLDRPSPGSEVGGSACKCADGTASTRQHLLADSAGNSVVRDFDCNLWKVWDSHALVRVGPTSFSPGFGVTSTFNECFAKQVRS